MRHFRTVQEFLDTLLLNNQIIAFKERWLLNDNLSTIYDHNAIFQCVAVSSVGDIDYVKRQVSPYGGTAILWSKSFRNDFKVLYKDESGRVTAVKFFKRIMFVS